jgi:hypothetical protein
VTLTTHQTISPSPATRTHINQHIHRNTQSHTGQTRQIKAKIAGTSVLSICGTKIRCNRQTIRKTLHFQHQPTTTYTSADLHVYPLQRRLAVNTSKHSGTCFKNNRVAHVSLRALKTMGLAHYIHIYIMLETGNCEHLKIVVVLTSRRTAMICHP